MEADSMHATIERKIKNRYIYLPGDYTEEKPHPEP